MKRLPAQTSSTYSNDDSSSRGNSLSSHHQTPIECRPSKNSSPASSANAGRPSAFTQIRLMSNGATVFGGVANSCPCRLFGANSPTGNNGHPVRVEGPNELARHLAHAQLSVQVARHVHAERPFGGGPRSGAAGSTTSGSSASAIGISRLARTRPPIRGIPPRWPGRPGPGRPRGGPAGSREGSPGSGSPRSAPPVVAGALHHARNSRSPSSSNSEPVTSSSRTARR